ncbi:MAG TPA: hypothetical protein PLP23_19670 [Panacibacter sp.]|nr:hypothetical protein [Panacibacter sp.]
MRFIAFILSIFLVLNAKAQIIYKDLKTSGSLKIVDSTILRPSSYAHDIPIIKPPKKDPLLIVDCKRRPFKSINQIDSKLVANVSVLKGKEAIKKYGRKAKGGVIIVETKKD